MFETIKIQRLDWKGKEQGRRDENISYYNFLYTSKRGKPFHLSLSLIKKHHELKFDIHANEQENTKESVSVALELFRQALAILKEKTKIKRELSSDFKVTTGYTTISYFYFQQDRFKNAEMEKLMKWLVKCFDATQAQMQAVSLEEWL